VLASQLEEARNVRAIVLAVSVDLQHVRVAAPVRLGEARRHGRDLALVARQPHQGHLRGLCLHQGIEHGGAGAVAAVIHQDAGQPV
jgi:hypothetical protein